MATWPASLPQRLQVNGFSGQLPDGSVRQDMDSGPSYQRQRYTAAPERFSGRIWVDYTQYATFRDFWVTTLAHGSLSFDWVHPMTNAAATVQFDVSQPPQVSAISGTLFEVALTFEVLP